ncbi:MAG: hypothetical protein IPK19_25765 [Chloroflexi bacterium]|nr:hypothetical protein [Chloroflexota bacterium]
MWTRGITICTRTGTPATTVARLAAGLAHVPYSLYGPCQRYFHESVQPDDLDRKLCDAAFTVTVSRYNEQFLHEEYPDSTGHLTCIYNGLDLSEFPYQEPSQRMARLVAVGRLVEKKGFTYLVDACRVLADTGYSFHLDLIGGVKKNLHCVHRSLGSDWNRSSPSTAHVLRVT